MSVNTWKLHTKNVWSLRKHFKCSVPPSIPETGWATQFEFGTSKKKNGWRLSNNLSTWFGYCSGGIPATGKQAQQRQAANIGHRARQKKEQGCKQKSGTREPSSIYPQQSAAASRLSRAKWQAGSAETSSEHRPQSQAEKEARLQAKSGTTEPSSEQVQRSQAARRLRGAKQQADSVKPSNK